MFKSAHHALQFAFRTMGVPIIKMSSVNSMRGAAGNGDLTPHDRHAQAAMIVSIVEKVVDVNGQAFLRAHYGSELFGGEHERQLANHLVQVVIGTLPTGMYSRRGVEKLVRIYFGQKIGMAAVRRDMRCGIKRVNECRDLVYQTLSSIGRRADIAADTALREAGLILEAGEVPA